MLYLECYFCEHMIKQAVLVLLPVQYVAYMAGFRWLGKAQTALSEERNFRTSNENRV